MRKKGFDGTKVLNLYDKVTGIFNEIFDSRLDAKCVPTEKTQRVYFNLYFDDDKMLLPCNDEIIGQTCNFVYPK